MRHAAKSAKRTAPVIAAFLITVCGITVLCGMATAGIRTRRALTGAAAVPPLFEDGEFCIAPLSRTDALPLFPVAMEEQWIERFLEILQK